MEYKKVFRAGLPKSLAGQLRRIPLYCAGLLTLYVPMLGVILREVSGGDGPILDWTVGVLLWVLAILLVPFYAIFAVRVRSAATAYAGMALAVLPTGLAILDGGIRLAVQILGVGSTVVIGICLLGGLATLPSVVRSRRKWFQVALRSGHLKRSLDRTTGRWDPQYDLDTLETSELLNRPGCLIRLLPWVGPAIGMSLDNIFGQAVAERIFVYVILGLGYGFTYVPIGGALVQVHEFRRMEKELGRPILLDDQHTEN